MSHACQFGSQLAEINSNCSLSLDLDTVLVDEKGEFHFQVEEAKDDSQWKRRLGYLLL
jgi:hypothetical protein